MLQMSAQTYSAHKDLLISRLRPKLYQTSLTEDAVRAVRFVILRYGLDLSSFTRWLNETLDHRGEMCLCPQNGCQRFHGCHVCLQVHHFSMIIILKQTILPMLMKSFSKFNSKISSEFTLLLRTSYILTRAKDSLRLTKATNPTSIMENVRFDYSESLWCFLCILLWRLSERSKFTDALQQALPGTLPPPRGSQATENIPKMAPD